MSDYIVYKKVICTHPSQRTTFERYAEKCRICMDNDFTLVEADFEEAIIEVLVKSLKQNSRLSRLIRQTSVLPKLR